MAAFFAAIEKLFAGLRRLVLGQPRRQELLAELLQVLQGKPIGAKALFKFLLGVVERVAAVHHPQQEMFVLLEAVIAQADRILDDVVSPPFVFLRLDGEIGAHAQLHVFAAFQIAGGGFWFHDGYDLLRGARP